ncbi:thiamine pyrophosphate-dependent enzyme [Streptomyces sp. NPDC091266]|uniref:thiamine pyrophosphate-dependent enzyme n=1 Tax=Streptomyces sp. NPDC091266 TaxID=3365978 RepID=UPI0037FE5F7E
MLDIRAALTALLDRDPSALYVTTCGFITRDVYNIADRPGHFYLVGSMGMAAPVGLGVALARPDRRVVVLDGDGSFAMNPGCLPMIAEHRPDLLHVVLDNGAHESTGGQRTAALGDPVALARAAGYPAAHTVDTLDGLAAVDPPRGSGPTLLHVRCLPRTHKAGRRVELTPQQLVTRFRAEATAAVAATVEGNPL